MVIALRLWVLLLFLAILVSGAFLVCVAPKITRESDGSSETFGRVAVVLAVAFMALWAIIALSGAGFCLFAFWYVGQLGLEAWQKGETRSAVAAFVFSIGGVAGLGFLVSKADWRTAFPKKRRF